MEDGTLELEQLKVYFEKNVELSKYTNTRTGGRVKYLFFPTNINELKTLLTFFHTKKIPFEILGGMTNVAIASGELDFMIISMSKFISKPLFDEKKSILTVAAGSEMKKISIWARDHSLSGLQWMEGIPGTIGAGAFMNAGFLPGQDFGNFMIDAEVLMPDGTIRIITNREMNFSYRKSLLQSNDGIVLSVRFLLRKGKKWKIAIRMGQYHKRRAKHQPLELPSAGTVFVPPTPYHVGGMIPQLGLVGYRIGGAQISEKSPGFIVGIDNMTGEDYYSLLKFIQKQVFDHFDIELEPEVRLLGFSPHEENKQR